VLGFLIWGGGRAAEWRAAGGRLLRAGERRERGGTVARGEPVGFLPPTLPPFLAIRIALHCYASLAALSLFLVPLPLPLSPSFSHAACCLLVRELRRALFFLFPVPCSVPSIESQT